ncbi:MAG: hypothetical protein ACQEUT_12985 [Bacillota bacterium]
MRKRKRLRILFNIFLIIAFLIAGWYTYPSSLSNWMLFVAGIGFFITLGLFGRSSKSKT